MKFFVVVRTAPAYVPYHSYVASTLKSLVNKGHGLTAVFFTDGGASLASAMHAAGTNAKNIQDMYLALKSGEMPFLCCGQAFRALGLAEEDLHEEFALSGNLELTQCFCAYKTLEF